MSPKRFWITTSFIGQSTRSLSRKQQIPRRYCHPVFVRISGETSENLSFSSIQTTIKAIIIIVTSSDTHSIPDALNLPAPPVLCRIAVGILGVFVAASAFPWVYYSINHFGGFDWGLMGFELLTILAGIFAVLLAMGKFQSGWAIGVTAISGAVMVALVFGLYVGFIMAKQTDFPSLAPLAKYTFMGRAAAIAGFFFFASIAVFVRNKASLPFIIKSLLCAAPVVMVGAMMKFSVGPGAWINNALNTSSGTGATSAVLSITLGLFFIILVSASGHLLIRAYECGRPERINGS